MRHKFLLVAFLATSLAGIVFAQTPLEKKNAYAYDVQVTADESYAFATVSYRLNAPATGVKVLATVDGQATEYDGTTIADAENNLNQVTVPLSGIKNGKVVSFSVKVTSDVVPKATVCETGYRFYHPQGVAVDNNPESPYFGRVYATECMPVSKDPYIANTNGNGVGQALYVFDPTMQPVANKDGKYGFTGGNTFNAKFSDGVQDYDPRKVRITKDGRVFVSAQNEKGVAVYELNPADLNADWTPLIYGTPDTECAYRGVDEEGNFICATNISFDVKGSGENLQMVVLSDDNPGGYTPARRRVDEYNIGTATSWNKVPSKSIAALSGRYTITSSNVNIVYDNEGGIWYFQFRGIPTETEPAIVHVNAEGVEDYKSLQGNLRAGAVCFNNDFSLLAFANAPGSVGVYTVTKDEAGKPVLTEQYSFATTIGGNCNDIAWDCANNLYIVGNSGEWLKTVVLPRTNGDVITPAASRYDVQISKAPCFSGEPLYFKPSSKWQEADARFAAYFFSKGDNGASVWADCVLAPNEAGVYTVTPTEADKWEYVIFVRMNPATTENDWSNKWDQTGDLAAQEELNYFVMTGTEWENTGEWTTYAAPTYTVAGVAALLGTEWNVTAEENDMTEENGIWTLVKTGVALEAGTYEYKVAYNHAWAVAYPAGNATLEIPVAGIYTVTFTFNYATKEVNATAQKEGLDTSVAETEVYTGIFVRNNVVCVETAAGTPVQVYSLSGCLLYNAPAVAGTTEIAGLPAGILLVRVAGETAKVAVR